MKLRDLLKEIKAVPGGDVIVLALINKLKADDQFNEGYKVIAYKKSKIKLKTHNQFNTEKYLIELLIQINFVRDDGKNEYKIVDYFYFPEFDHFEYYNTFFGAYDPKGEILQTLIRDRDFTEINPPITEIKAKPPLKLPSGFDIEQAFYDFFNIRQISLPKGNFNKDEQFLGIKYKMIDGEELIVFYFQVGGMFNEKFQVAYNLDDLYSPDKNYTKWLGYQEIDQTDLIKEIKAVPARAHPLNIAAIWDFVSRDELKGDTGPFDINKNYIGFEIKPFVPSTNNMHLLKTYFRDNDGYPFVVIYSYNYGRENGYDFYNWWNLYPNEPDESDEIPNDLLREITDFNGFNRMTRYERVNEIKARRPQPNLLKLIEDNIEFIKKEFIIQRIKSIKLVMNNPQEVEIHAVIFIDGDDEDDEMEIGIVFRFLEDAENDEMFSSDFGHDPDLDYITLTLDGIRVAAIENEI